MGYYPSVDPNDVDGVSNVTGAGLLDRTLAHEFTHAIMATNVNYFNTLPKFIKEGLAELTHGIDDQRKTEIMNLATINSNMNNVLPGAKDSSTNYGSYTYAAGYILMRYFARQAALQSLNCPVFGDISVDVDFSTLNNLAAGNVLYIDTSKPRPTVQVATDLDTFAALTDTNLYNIGYIDTTDRGSLAYVVDNDLVNQNITTGGQIGEIYQLNSRTKLTGTDAPDAVQIVEGATEVNTGGGNDIVQVTGQYATINTGAGNDQVDIVVGGHNLIDLGVDSDDATNLNIVNIQGSPFYNGNLDVYYSQNFDNTIKGGRGNDIIQNSIGVLFVDENNAKYTENDVLFADEEGVGHRVSEIGLKNIENYTPYVWKQYTDSETGELTEGWVQAEILTPKAFFAEICNNLIDLGDGSNQIYIDNTTIKTGEGNDIISIYAQGYYASEKNVIEAGGGSDFIQVLGVNNSIVGGADNDTIKALGGNNTIVGGEGNDYIVNVNSIYGNNVYVYNGVFDNDVIKNFTSTDKIKLGAGFTYTLTDETTGQTAYKKLTVTKGDITQGTISVVLAEGATFDAAANIIFEPICRIGLTGYTTLDDAITAADRKSVV